MANARKLAPRARFLWGGLGAMTPIVTSFLILDIETITGYLGSLGTEGGPILIAGYLIRVAGLFAVGGIWAMLHKLEYDPKKLFQLGIVAPAMITGMINASNVYDSRDPASEHASAVRITLISSAYAGDKAGDAKEDDSPVQQLIKGFLGKRGK